MSDLEPCEVVTITAGDTTREIRVDETVRRADQPLSEKVVAVDEHDRITLITGGLPRWASISLILTLLISQSVRSVI